MEFSSTVARLSTLDIDPRSFHVFEYGDDHLMFDRATSSTLELNDVAFDFLKFVEQEGIQSAVPSMISRYPEIDIDGVVEALTVMKNKGMFRFQPVDRTEQDLQLEALWMHQPRRIQLLMAQGCNLGCRYCYAWRNGSNQKHTLMPFDIARRAVDYLVWRSGFRPEVQVTFFGGEPLLNYSVVRQVVEYARGLEKAQKKTFIFELCTNCTLLDADVTDFLVKEKFLLFMSIDGWREMHNYNRPSMQKDDLYDVIVKNAQYAQEQYEIHGLQTPRVRANLTDKYHDMKAVGEYLESLGFTNNAVALIEPLPHGDPSPAALTEDQADELHDQWQEMTATILDKMKEGKDLSIYETKSLYHTSSRPEKVSTMGIGCGIGRNTLIVDNKGNMFPCHRYEGMDAFILGNIFTGLDRERTMRYYRTVNGHATDHCDDCWIRDYCGGGCAWLLSARNGHLADPTERECHRRRHGQEIMLGVRADLRKNFPKRFQNDAELSVDQWDWGGSNTVRPQVRKLSLNVLSQPSVSGSSCGS